MRSRRLRVTASIALAVTLAVAAVASVFVGSRPLAPGDVWAALTGGAVDPDIAILVNELRVPRAALGAVAGVGLGVAGCLMQALTRNPLAEPGILGVNAGASAAVVTGIVFASLLGMPLGGGVGTFAMLVMSFVGAGIASVLVLMLGGAFRSGTDPVRLTLAGAALSVVLGAYVNAMLLNRPGDFRSFMHWAMGSTQGRNWDVIVPVAIIVVVAAVLACLCGRWLNALALGHDVGRSLGASPRRTTWICGTLVVLLAGSVTAAAGPIAFVGLAAPLAVRALIGPDYRWLVPLSGLCAGVIVIGADMVGRIVVAPAEVEAAIVAAIVGGPVFIAMARRRKWARL